MKESDDLRNVAEFISNLFRSTLSEDMTYHTFHHTAEVFEASQVIGAASGLNAEQLMLLGLAAWMHDVGYTQTYEQHEEKGVEIATSYMQERGYTGEQIQIVAECILATKMPQRPENLLEEILCDADISYIGKKGFIERSSLLRAEWEHCVARHYTDNEWLRLNVNFIANHQFFTPYARREFAEQHGANILKLQEKLVALFPEERTL